MSGITKYRYFMCSNGHRITVIVEHNKRTVRKCPVFVLGKPCEGMVCEVGPQGGTLRKPKAMAV